MLLFILVAVAAFQGWTWHRLSGRVESGALTKLQAIVRYGLWAQAPPLLFLGIFFGAVGLEEWLGIALLSEPTARATAPIVALLLGIAGLGSACFGVRCAFIKRSPAASP